MLLYFKVGGYLSFKEPQIIDFTPALGARIKGTKYENNYHLNTPKHLPRIMKSAVIFGDNATGKTNWFYGLKDCLEIIDKGLNIDLETTFNINSNDIIFEIGLSDQEQNVYDYTLRFNDDNIISYESLLINNKEIFTFTNKKLKIRKENQTNNKLEELYKNIKPTNTFISGLKDFLPKDIKSFIKASQNIIIARESIINEEHKNAPNFIILTEEGKNIINKYRSEVIEILKDMDPSIDNFNIIEITTKNKNGYEIEIVRNHTNYSIRYESKGVKKIVNLLTDILQIFEGKTLLIDELDSSIGTKSLIKLFNNIINTEKNTNGQLIISSHNLALLKFSIFNSSQMYVLSKNNDIETRINSISDYDLRYENRSLDSLYLNGSFEA